MTGRGVRGLPGGGGCWIEASGQGALAGGGSDAWGRKGSSRRGQKPSLRQQPSPGGGCSPKGALHHGHHLCLGRLGQAPGGNPPAGAWRWARACDSLPGSLSPRGSGRRGFQPFAAP
ncbi:hypothetical protein KIL84_001226 [Mauremys mutica]|uniref:Uncharacterized protein n=1 Tax=Mauremys mutica TaxID=74926 RepID=A0A9D3WYR1_9SAUR|nr:hypothetical protein KIL84_001226 [Mauremys mutica]